MQPQYRHVRLERLLISLDDDPDAIEFKEFAQRLSLEGPQTERAAALFRSMYRAFVELDASLIEINPLAVTTDGELMALDVKMAIDDNALYRHPELEDLRDATGLVRARCTSSVSGPMLL